MSAPAQHTPGPWAYDADSGAIYRDDGDVEPLVASTNFEGVSIEQGNADGHLIAAAPDLLAIARHYLANAEARRNRAKVYTDAEGNPSKADIQAEIDALSAAIAKAEGRS